METEKHYFKVGLFALAALAGFIYYLVAFGGEGGVHNLKRYTVYFDRSINGLERGAPVKLKGIAVGQVSDIRFVSPESARIRVTADISETAPVRADTVASVTFQGITGATYLSLENTGPETGPLPLKKTEGEEYPVIPSGESELQTLLKGVPATMTQAQKLFSDKNIRETEALLPEAHDMLAEAAAAFREIKMLARTLREDPSIVLRGPKHQGYQVPR
jgi:phospholipid/cholesterol/gamma-HCH transport system substrate-binding protein